MGTTDRRLRVSVCVRMRSFGVHLMPRCCLSLLVSALALGQIQELGSEPELIQTRLVVGSNVNLGEAVVTTEAPATADATEAKHNRMVKEYTEKATAKHEAMIKARKDADKKEAADLVIAKEQHVKNLPPTNQDSTVNNPWAIRQERRKAKHPQDNESPEKASDKDAESFAKAMGNAVERTSKAHGKASEIKSKTKNMSREKDWKNKTRTYANASNFATSDEDWAARAGGYGADLIAQAKAQQDAAADSQKAQLDQVNKMVEEAEKATKAEKAKQEAGKELNAKRSANDAAIEKKTKNSLRKSLDSNR